MSFSIRKKLPPIEHLLHQYPLSDRGLDNIQQHRHEIRSILSGHDPRMVMIVGPCSAWPATAVVDYAHRLHELSDQIKDQIKIVMRVYSQKPRTREGWCGPLVQPNPLDEPDIERGILYVRRMMLKVIELGLPIASEAVFTHNTKSFIQLLSWMAVGARSVEDQEHRIFASSVDCPVGMKNPTHGSLNVALNAIIAAQQSHIAAFDGFEVQTYGNPYTHLVLRGSNDQPNHGLAHLREAYQLLNNKVKNPAIFIDASHDNSLVNGVKDPNQQPIIIEETLDLLNHHPELKPLIKGFMMESFIQTGCQVVDSSGSQDLDLNGLSITDPCLGWDETESFLLSLAARLKHE